MKRIVKKKKFKWEDLENVIFPNPGDKVICIKNFQNFKRDNEYEVKRLNIFHVWLSCKEFPEVGVNKQFFYDFFQNL